MNKYHQLFTLLYPLDQPKFFATTVVVDALHWTTRAAYKQPLSIAAAARTRVSEFLAAVYGGWFLLASLRKQLL